MQKSFTRPRLFLVILTVVICTNAFGQAFNIGRAALIENGFGASPNIAGANSIFISGNLAYVIGAGDAMEILDISFPALPIHKGGIKNGDGGARIFDPPAL